MRWETQAAIVLGALAVLMVLAALALDWWDERQLRRADQDDEAELDAFFASLNEP